MKHQYSPLWIPAVLLVCTLFAAGEAGAQTVDGEMCVWHRITVTFDGPSTSESATINPCYKRPFNVRNN